MLKQIKQLLIISITCFGFILICSADQHSADEYYYGGMYYLEKKKFINGIALLSKGIKEHPKSAKLYNLRATIFHQIKQYKKARSDFEKSYDLEPKNDSYRFDVDFINDLIKNEERKRSLKKQ